MSKIANSLRTEIAEITRRLIEIRLCVGYNFPEVKKTHSYRQVGLMNSGSFSIALRRQTRQHIYKTLVEENLFSMIFRDGSIVQISYLFDNNELLAHRLVYFPKPYGIDDVDVEAEHREYFVKNPMLRFDFSSTKHEDHYHSHSHLHIGQTEDCRIPVSSPLGPGLFICFLLRNFYNSDGKIYFEKYKYKKGQLFNKTIFTREENEIHINLPNLTK